jgi:uncharacterized protein (DUF1330 family)
MAAYIIADVDITDPVKYEDYKKLTPGAVAKHGGRFVARGGQTATLEGTWKPGRVVIIEFPTFEQARNFYTSVEYTAARRARAGAATFRMIAVDGGA